MESPMTREEFDQRIAELEKERDELAQTHEKVERLLAWHVEGRRLFEGEAPEQDRTITELFPPAEAFYGPRGVKPTLRQAIVATMRSAPGSEWPNSEVIAALDRHGWGPQGNNAAHIVRSKLAEMARMGELKNVARGTYMLPDHERGEDS